MVAFGTLSMFVFAVAMLLLSPGPNMAFVIAHGTTHVARGGLAAAFGIGAADIVLTILTATGITALVAAWPPAFDLIRYAGVVYLLHMAYKTFRQRDSANGKTAAGTTLTTVFLRSMLNSLLNPKALLFFMVFLPQFVDLNQGAVAQQLIVLGLVLTSVSVLFHALLGSAGGMAGQFIVGNARIRKFQPHALATLLVLLAVRLMFLQRPR